MKKKILIFTLIIIIFIIFVYLYIPTYTKYKIIYNKSLYKKNKLMIIAHPDDELLWGYRYIYNCPNEWKIICLTNAKNIKRINEFYKVLTLMNINNFEIWNHEDSLIGYNINKECQNNIIKELKNNNYELILTHNSYGEYGNIQHIGINNFMQKIKKKFHFPINYFKIDKYFYTIEKKNLIKIYSSQNIITYILNYLHPFY